MTEAEFERRQRSAVAAPAGTPSLEVPPIPEAVEPPPAETEPSPRAAGPARGRAPRAKPVKPRRVQRMFAIEEELDKKLWLYAIHVGKDRSDVVNDLLRPLVASMVLYDSRDRRAARAAETATDRAEYTDGEAA
jgi:hypothetical protein